MITCINCDCMNVVF